MNSKSTENFFNYSDRIDLIAIIKSNTTISYQDLFFKANQLANSLSGKGIEKGTYIPILIEDNFLFIKTLIALWYLGAIPVPLNTKLLDDEIKSILDDHVFKFLITDKIIELNFRLNDLEIVNLHRISIVNSELKSFTLPDLENESVIIFTSGSSGQPKGVVHTFSSLINSIKNGNDILNQKENDRWLASLPFYHIGGFQIICRSLYFGCTIVLPESLKTDDLVTEITRLNPTHISLVSAQLQKFCYLELGAIKSLKFTLVGGGFIEDDLMIEADILGWKPYRVYGSSETASMVTAISANEIKAKPQSVGKPFKDVKIKISDDSEILIKSNSLFKKYIHDENETSAKLIDGFYHTGDLGFIDDDGFLFIEARRTDLIVTGGENVNPIEVEKAILNIDGVKEVCVFPKLNKTWGQIVACVIVLNDTDLNEKIIKGNLKQSLAGFKIPKDIYFIEKLPRTSLGKLEREKIKKMF